jgi:hypothetical protein
MVAVQGLLFVFLVLALAMFAFCGIVGTEFLATKKFQHLY